MKKTLLTLTLLLLTAVMAMAQQDTVRREVLIETTMGNMRVALSNETPRHRDNFLRLVRSKYYDGTLFHRVIKDFMAQAGDSTTRHAKPDQRLGGYSPNYTVPAEFRFPALFHKRGALAAAREGDAQNPERASSSAQFYLVWGYQFNDPTLDRVQQRLDERTDSTVRLTPEVREAYKTLGGTPHLDGQYTVFGEVVEGLDVLERLQAVATDDHDRPVDDVRIVRMTIVR